MSASGTPTRRYSMFRLTGPDGRVIAATTSRDAAMCRFRDVLRKDGLPDVNGGLRLTETWVPEGGYGGKITRLVVAADRNGVYDLDDSRAPRTIAAPGMVDVWLAS